MRLRRGVSAPRTLIGGVGYRWQRDASFGVVASDALAQLSWPAGTEVMDLGYGALYVAEDLAAARPRYQRLILLAGVERGRERGRLYPYRWQPTGTPPEEVQEHIREAGAGIVHLDHLLIIAQHFQALPPEVDVLELEPVDATWGVELSPIAEERLQEAIALIRDVAAAQRRLG